MNQTSSKKGPLDGTLVLDLSRVLGASTASVVAEFGYSDAEISALIADGVVT